MLNENNQIKHVADSGGGAEKALVVRYMGAKDIKEMMKGRHYVEAFAHAQLGIEKILWDKIVGLFQGEKAMQVRRTIEKNKTRRIKKTRSTTTPAELIRSRTTTSELVKWAHFLGAITEPEFSDLNDFNDKRNNIIHGHGECWYPQEYSEALKKAIRFLRQNGF
ncbi:MAG: hypothetical protein FJ006_08265 [Chloroflexi bacterium]|nr:hypothetical protein [Chloroflexota bacterium]